MGKLKKASSSIILLVIGGLIIKTQVLIDESCQGFIEGIWLLFLCVIYLVALVVILMVPFFQSSKQNIPFNFLPLVTTLLIIVSFYAFASDKFDSSTKILAIMDDKGGMGKHILKLKENGSFVIQMREIEWSCFYKGNYNLIHDTIVLNRNVQSLTHSLFSDKYLIERSGKYLLPLDRSGKIKDSTQWLTIANSNEADK